MVDLPGLFGYNPIFGIETDFLNSFWIAMAGVNPSISGKKYHFIGAGGIGMSGLAKLLMKNGATVTGSDQEDSIVVEKLRRLGADIRIGHTASNVGAGTDAVVISAAILVSNPELVAAMEKGCKVYKYAQMLGELMDRYAGIAVCGTHGKSTVSGWLAFVLEKAGISPSYIVGAEIPQLGDSNGVGNGKYFIAEACEYDRSFLNLHPETAVILNIEQDHLDYYADEDEIVDAFAEFASGVKPKGTIIANISDPNVAKVLQRQKKGRKIITFGCGEVYDFCARNIELIDGLYHFDVFHHGDLLGRTGISLPGEHNILNALAVIAAAVSAEAEGKLILELLDKFSGIDRRIMLKGTIGGVTVLDDYAHHPTEIRASLSAIGQRYAPERLWCIFQPHQYSRTRFLLDDFAESFKLADITIVPEIYFVRDTAKSRNEVNAEVLVERIGREGSEAVFIDDFSRICEYLKANVKGGDLVVTMGAGDIWKVADEYIQWLRRNS